MKKSLSSLEVAALVRELQSLLNAKISQIYQSGEEFFLQLHAKEGKQFLRLIPGHLLNLSPHKKTSPTTSAFCLQLRKYLNQAFIRKIEQKGAERIILFSLEQKEKYFLILELLAPGNLILTDKDYQIIACLHRQEFKDRCLAPKEKYCFPPLVFNWLAATPPQLQKIIRESQKKSLVISLATEIGLGRLYAEEICLLNQLNKNQPPAPTSPEEIKKIYQTLQDFLQKLQAPQGFIYPEEITPFPLQGPSPLCQTKTYSEALRTLEIFSLVSPYEKKISSLRHTLQEQEAAVKKLEGEIALNRQKAELIYHHYLPLQKLLQIIKTLKETKTWEEIKTELSKEKRIKNIDLKNKKISIDLSEK